MLTKLTREARERLGPDATERQVAEAAEAARKAFYARLSAAGVAARRTALREALMRQRRSALAFEILEASRDHRGTPGSRVVALRTPNRPPSAGLPRSTVPRPIRPPQPEMKEPEGRILTNGLEFPL